jgi:hypothetical protein
VLGAVCLALGALLAREEPRSDVGRPERGPVDGRPERESDGGRPERGLDPELSPEPGPELGLELLALAEALGSRQDFKALMREPVLAAAAERFGAAEVAEARARVAALGRERLAEHVLTTLERSGRRT